MENRADPNGLEIMVQELTPSLKGISKGPGNRSKQKLSFGFSMIYKTGYSLIENSFHVTGRVDCTAFYVHGHPPLMFSDRTQSKRSRTSLTVVRVENPGWSKQTRRYKCISSRGTWTDKNQLNNLQTALTKNH